MSKTEELFDRCQNVLPGHGPRRGMKAVFQELADSLDGSETLDRYGEGEYLSAFETEVAAMFGKPAAVFLPSGTMAQQIALRIWCERSNNFTVAMHPTAHPEFAEHFSYQYLHGLRRIQFGAPEFLGNRMLTLKDFQSLGKKPGVILLELPYRPLGGQLPEWDELNAIHDWALDNKIPFHLDGARIWQCKPFYQKEYHQIGELFDSLYVSFYKDLGGLCGSMLLGSEDFIQEAKMWQVRYGGRLFTQAPFIVSDRLGMQRVLPQIDSWVERARKVAAILSEFEQLTVNPNPPHVNFFQLYVKGDPEKMIQRHMEVAEETGTFLFHNLSQTAVPGIGMTEIHCFENALRFDLESLRPFLEKWLK
ncbi:MAG: beta-eliminating lyase-related protein [Anaerolineales bacterium]